MNKEEWKQELKQLGLELSEDQETKLDQFYHLLIEWNQKMNLTRIVQKEEVYLKHFYDSLTLVKIANFGASKTLCDIGTGAGFPGIVLKICFPQLKITLVDSLKKRIDYLNEVIKVLGLVEIKAIHIRAEDYHKTALQTFDYVTARAVARLSTLLDYGMLLVKKGGAFLVMKGKVEEELLEAQQKMHHKKYRIVQKETFFLPVEQSVRTLLRIEKEEETNKKD